MDALQTAQTQLLHTMDNLTYTKRMKKQAK